MKVDKIICMMSFTFLLVVGLLAVSPSISSAYTGYNVYANRFQQCFECTLQDTGRDGSVTIAMFTANSKVKNYTVRMTDENGRYIWGEDGALRAPSGTRTFRLGRDHKVYKIYIKGNGGSGAVGTATISGKNNVSVTTRSR